MKKLYLYLLCSILTFTLAAQRNYLITNVNDKPNVDGILDEAFWESIPATDSFTTALPAFGRIPKNATTVKMAYTKHGIYVAVACFTPQTRKDGSKRDELGTGDYFSIGLDTWDDDQNAFVFTANAAGQRIDQRLSSNYDGMGFDTPWFVKTHREVDRWTAEIYIPFIALRFPKQKKQDWGLQFTRFDRSTGELSTWNPQNPLVSDIVLQYGTLSSMNIENPKERIGITGHMSANEETITGSARIDTSLFLTGLEGRIGVNSATTLDFTITPTAEFTEIYNTGTFFSFNPFNIPPPLPTIVPLQSSEEERGIFQKSNILEYNRSIAPGFTAAKVAPNPSSVFFYETTGGRLLNRTRFTTRTKDNIGIAVSNAIYGAYEHRFSTSTGDITRNTGKQIYNSIAIEKCLRNNSWIQFANNYHHAAADITTNLAALSTQLRDKSNHYELKSTLKLQSQDHFSVADGRVELSRINSALNYGVSYQSPIKTGAGLLLPLHIYTPRINPNILKGFLSRRSFAPRHPRWQNTTKTLHISRYWTKNELDLIPVEVEASFTGLDQKFRQASVALVLNPLGVTESLPLSDITILRKIKWPIGLCAGFDSDQRKRYVGHIAVGSDWAGSNHFSHALDLSAYWVPHATFKIEVSSQIALLTNMDMNSSILPITRNIEQSNTASSANRLAVHWFPYRKFSLELYMVHNYANIFKREMYKLSNEGTFEPVDYLFEYATKRTQWNLLGGELQWNFTKISRLVFGIRQGDGNYFFSQSPPPIGAGIENEGDRYNNKVYLGFVWNLNCSIEDNKLQIK
jgi:Domain of unknown function (DUF5916)